MGKQHNKKNIRRVSPIIAKSISTLRKITIKKTTKIFNNLQAKNIPELMLLEIVKNGASIIKILVKNGVDINARDNEGFTALILAIRFSQIFGVSIVEALIDFGADVDLQDNDGCTALMWAITHGNLAIVKILIGHHAKINASNNDNCTALMFAACYSNFATIKMLINHHAEIDAANNEGNTALMIASHYSRFDSHIAIIEALISAGANVNLKNHDGRTPLNFASRHSHNLKIITALLASNADIDSQCNVGFTALMATIDSNCDNYLKTVELLISLGANINLQDNDGWSALMIAAFLSGKKSNSAALQLLIDYGAMVDLQSNKGYTALMLASHEVMLNDSTLEYFDPSGYESQLKSRRYLNDENLKTTRILIKAAANVNLKTVFGSTALSLASCFTGETSVVIIKELINAGANLETTCSQKSSALSSAIRYCKTTGNMEIIKTLIDAGANVNVNRNKHNSPLMLTMQDLNMDNFITAVLLVKAGAN